MIEQLFIFLIGLCWGSFINVLAYRLVHDITTIRTRSFCPYCKRTLAWYDLIPVISYIWLGGKCRFCKKPISWLYPFIELSMGAIAVLLFCSVAPQYLIAYYIFFSMLLVSVRTDLEALLVFRRATLAIIPFGFAAAFLDMLPLTLTESIIGTLFGYGLLWLTRKIFYLIKKQEGLGIGDLYIMALIGAFTGPQGVWCALSLGGLSGLVYAIIAFAIVRLHHKNISFAAFKTIKIPFVPFLVFGAFIYVLFFNYFTELFIPLVSAL